MNLFTSVGEKLGASFERRCISVFGLPALQVFSNNEKFDSQNMETFNSFAIKWWLVLTGCYPSSVEVSKFQDEVILFGLGKASERLIGERAANKDTLHFMQSVSLVSPYGGEVLDVSHTISAPYVTGIQRVVINLLAATKDNVAYRWIGDTGVIVSSDAKVLTSENLPVGHHAFEQKLIARMHLISSRLDKRRSTRRLKMFVIPAARSLRKVLIERLIRNQLSANSQIVNTNLFGSRVTVVEIPSSKRVISTYELLFKNGLVRSQVFVHDLIPFFHGWTVHEGNRGHLNLYIRIALFADRLMVPSNIVQLQLSSFVNGFRSERPAWHSKISKIDVITLPSGVRGLAAGETVLKRSNSLVLLGSIEPRKNHITVLRALSVLQSRGVYFQVHLIGKTGWYNSNVFNFVEELIARGAKITVAENMDDEELREVVSSAQAVVQLSEAEGFGLPVLEALSLGTRVVLSKIRPFLDFNFPNTYYVDVDDFHELATTLQHLFENPDAISRANQFSKSWKEFAEQIFELD